MPTGAIEFHDLSPAAASFRDDVVSGLTRQPKQLPSKYFYDDVGSALFDAICGLEEYYPTRTETALMHRHSAEIAAHLGTDCALVEFGSGMSRKSQLLIAAAKPAVYVPIEISRETLRAAADTLVRVFPELRVVAICADYSAPLKMPALAAFAPRRRGIYFPGSTIGNFNPEDAVGFLKNAAEIAGTGGGLLIGVDLKKDKALLDAAYDDPQGVTAAFNLNLLARINRELNANFDVRAFRHRAEYVVERGRIEMHLESLRVQSVLIGATKILFERGETIHPENSYKSAVHQFQALAERAGFSASQCWIDDRELFSIHYMQC